jgi:hypothetical protein
MQRAWRVSVSVVLGLIVVSASALALIRDASAHFDTGHYTHEDCPASNYDRVDPINFVFWDWGTIGRAENAVVAHTGWTNTSGSAQTFVDHGACYPMGGQRASGGAASSRYHVRLHPIHADGALGWTTVGAVHHEDFVWSCGHAVDSNGPGGSGFDQGRKQLRILLENGGHSWYSTWWGNTQNFKQCDGDYAGSDGYTVFVKAHQAFH